MLEFQERLDTALRHRVWILGGAVWSQELDSVILTSPFQLWMFYDSVILLTAAGLFGFVVVIFLFVFLFFSHCDS